jgi:hypothetical protein
MEAWKVLCENEGIELVDDYIDLPQRVKDNANQNFILHNVIDLQLRDTFCYCDAWH